MIFQLWKKFLFSNHLFWSLKVILKRKKTKKIKKLFFSSFWQTNQEIENFFRVSFKKSLTRLDIGILQIFLKNFEIFLSFFSGTKTPTKKFRRNNFPTIFSRFSLLIHLKIQKKFKNFWKKRIYHQLSPTRHKISRERSLLSRVFKDPS